MQLRTLIILAISVLGVPVRVSAECSGLDSTGMEALGVATVRFRN